MKPVVNSSPDLIGSKWEPLRGGRCFTDNWGLVIIDRIEGDYIVYHYEKKKSTFPFEQRGRDFFSFARRVL